MVEPRDPVIEHARRSIRLALFGRADPSEISEPGAPPGSTPKIDRFELVDKLGEGGMGIVYSARDPRLDRKVAIKLLRPAHAATRGGEERLMREARALARLAHPNVVVIHEVGLHQRQVYLVMEFIDGQPLGSWCRDHADDWRAIVERCCEAGRGLAAAHDAGFVHRDFKPENVLVARDDRVRVLDFGLAASGGSIDGATTEVTHGESAITDGLTATGAILGTPAYMAPEQHDGAIVDARADQFAFCVTLWEALFARRPFDGRTVASLREALRRDQPDPPPHGSPVSPPIVAALRRGLSSDPSRRFDSMAELLAELDRALKAGPIRPRRRTARWILSGAAVAGLAMASFLWAAPSADPDASASSVDPSGTGVPPFQVSLRRLTQTPGRGVDWLSADPTRNRMLYFQGDYWLRPLDGGTPTKLELPVEDIRGVVLAPDGGFVVSHGGSDISHIDASGRVRRVGWDAQRGVREWTLSRDGRYLAAAAARGIAVWDLHNPGSPRTIELPPQEVFSMAWSPDGEALAVTMGSVTAPMVFLIIERGGQVLAETTIEPLWPTVAWLPGGKLVVLEHDTEEYWLQCYELIDRAIMPGRRSAPVGPHERFQRVVAAPTDEMLLLQLGGVHNDVARVAVGDPAELSVLSPQWDSDDRDPVWLADGGLAIVTKRHLDQRLVRVGPHNANVTPLVDDVVAWAETDGAGGIVFATEGASGRLRWLPAGADAAVDVEVELRSVAAETRIACIRPDDCIFAQKNGQTMDLYGLDLTTGRAERRFPCQDEWRCHGRRGWTYLRNGKAMLFITSSQRQLVEVDARTGAPLRTHPEPPEDQLIQAVRQSTVDDSYWLTGMSGPWDSKLPYLLYHYQPGGPYDVVWHGEGPWLSAPEPSPDGTELALDALSFHMEGWLADIEGMCAD